ncbi:hypothetical protein [Halostella litorea]|uniref:hypothetical protein n=1 Tax=Halostella litorea TaxID=2528831 RepID=UPI001093323A|nr:hypothetical protein [Halostella litorea]
MRPTAHRAASFLLAALLLASAVAGPAAAATATAPTADTRGAATASTPTADLAAQADDGECELWESVLGQCTGPLEFVKIGEDQTAEAVKTDLHVTMSGEWENQQAFLTTTNNYLEDTRSIASIDGKSAIADSWERGNSTSQATQNVREAIRDYYAMQQIQLLNKYQQQMAQIHYAKNVSANNPDIDNSFVSVGIVNITDEYGNSASRDPEYEITNRNHDVPMTEVDVTLVNGTSESIQVPQIAVNLNEVGADNDWEMEYWPVEPFQRWKLTPQGNRGGSMSSHAVVPPNDGVSISQGFHLNTTGTYVVQNVGDVSQGGLPSKRVVDLVEWRRTWNDIEQQSQTMTANYDPTLTENLYAALDSGKIDPEDVRGAEGQVRWLSGNSSVGDRRWQQATLSVLDLANQNRSQASQIVVSYTGYTDLSFSNSTDGTREPVYGDRVENQTYTGMLFANPPSGGFSAGETYDVSNLEGTPTMYDNSTGETIPLVKGNVTIEALYAANGSEVDNADWDDPQYDTYNSTKYVEYINKSVTHRKHITNNYNSEPSGASAGIGLPDFGLGDVGPGDLFAGVGIMVVAGGVVVLVVLRG